MKSTGAVITEIVEAYHSSPKNWVRISDIAQARNLTPAEVNDAISELMGDEDFRAEPHPNNGSITGADRTYAPVIGGEPRHLIRWG